MNPKGTHLMNGKETNKGQGLDKNPQNINRDGRPKSAIRKVVDALKEKGHEPASRADIESAYIILTGLTEESLIALYLDDENPMLIRTVAKSLIEGFKKGHGALESILLRGIGAPKGSGDTPPPMIIDKANILVQLPQISKSQE